MGGERGGQSNKQKTITFFISAPTSRPNIDPPSRPLFSRAPTPCPPPQEKNQKTLKAKSLQTKKNQTKQKKKVNKRKRIYRPY